MSAASKGQAGAQTGSSPRPIIRRGAAAAGTAWMLAGLALPTQAAARPVECQAIQNARLIAADGTFLGRFSNPSHKDSLMNRNGPYGSKAASTSLWNAHGPYGSTASAKSPMNAHGGTPASIIKDGQTLGKLMRNSLRSWFEDPARLVHRCYGFVP